MLFIFAVQTYAWNSSLVSNSKSEVKLEAMRIWPYTSVQFFVEKFQLNDICTTVHVHIVLDEHMARFQHLANRKLSALLFKVNF